MSITTTTDLKVGFVGFGTIASAIATGFGIHDGSKSVSFSHFHVSQRSAAKSQALLAQFGASKVTVAESSDNQVILDSSDLIFLCVLPEQLETVLSQLTFDPDRHTLVSLVSTSKIDQLVASSKLPASRVHKMICLPSVATHDGTCLLVPPSPPLNSILEVLGGCVQCETEDIMTKLMIPACLMGPYYAILKNNRDWLVKMGVPVEDASYFVGRTYLGIAKDAEAKCRDPKGFDDLIEEQTPGGINEQSIKNLEKLGIFGAYDKAMDGILERLTGKGSGDC
mmetsp:Transcript_2592/g.4687  ORF Transcript_2592/g.4687 Transcript_2592/m.4687 type:complete len:281 (-) Transcript_2592:103-945(-)|eukprot:CAMPEP_0182498038 /NCGR_PEP_ID=MMETSP1321-20130603/6375_1 /TAXON_ID=91990 /ORGANISM="Bolidomonas sp., Strain RCC1657" /LENGTH=280 /DNA_ID=CAMNT_0024702043 /DNA_START=186 /DNA_END=1028 /DNA_ORIENTATION=-